MRTDTPGGIVANMKLPEEHSVDVLKRLRRVEGQVRGIQAMIEEGRECSDVVTQFAAAIRALERSGFKFLANTMAECNRHPDAAASEGYTADKLEKLFLQLA